MKHFGEMFCLGVFAFGLMSASTIATDDPNPRACCTKNGKCTNKNLADCAGVRGYSGPTGSSCDNYICGCQKVYDGCSSACCFDDGNCYDSTPMHCLDVGGNPQAEGTSCTDMVCDCTLPAEQCANVACCLPDGTCAELPKDQCNLRGGQQGGIGTTCDNFLCGCPELPGGCEVACCFEDGYCWDKPPWLCFEMGGTPDYDNTCTDACFTCPCSVAPDQCDVRGCHLPTGVCVNTAKDQCIFFLDGNPEPFGVLCEDADEFPCDSLQCRMTGGGVDCFDGVFVDGDCTGASGKMKKIDGINVYTFGGQAGAPTASQPQPWGEWTHVQHDGPDGQWTFHVGTASAPVDTEIDVITCSDPGWCVQARPAPAKQLDFEGVGSFKNIIDNPYGPVAAKGTTRHWVHVHIEDLGEPGRSGKQGSAQGCPLDGSFGAIADCGCPDFYDITIHETADSGSPVLYHVHGYIGGGNFQIHPAIK